MRSTISAGCCAAMAWPWTRRRWPARRSTGGVASRELKVLKTPLYSRAAARGWRRQRADAVDVAALLRDEVATPRRARSSPISSRGRSPRSCASPSKNIDPRRPLSEIGMDSLMGLELEAGGRAALRRRSAADGADGGQVARRYRVAHDRAVAPDHRRTQRRRRPEPLALPQQGRPLLEQHGAGAIAAEGFDRLAEAVERAAQGHRRDLPDEGAPGHRPALGRGQGEAARLGAAAVRAAAASGARRAPARLVRDPAGIRGVPRHARGVRSARHRQSVLSPARRPRRRDQHRSPAGRS